ncbi:MAG: DUF2029 domain-containing protein [Proteobacteria bacterium]|nr:DUF2029 domain-containing protein [Pseudomonadota bacterium]NDC23249.1 DUF2029 domain-containing protein [Pseudomonadota bacterium]NDD03471.1 DUF2029 domain-containing protein [Pseudomonadota bacterium]NDG25805.1 DUF2029 domain-containing protein [Pseudomonadota bacterium]
MKKQGNAIQSVFVVIALLCSVQALKGIDFRGYLESMNVSLLQGLNPPYPTHSAKNGDFFQSPITAVFLIPLALLPMGIAKLIAWAYSFGGLFYLFRRATLGNLTNPSAFLLLLFFTHAISDVFLSLNFLFLGLVLMWACHEWSLRKEPWGQLLSGLFFSVAVALRPMPLLLLPYFVLSPGRRRMLIWFFGWTAAWIALTLLVLPNPRLWWTHWFSALPLYEQAASILVPAFQTPMAVLGRSFYFFSSVTLSQFAFIEKVIGLAFWGWAFFWALRLEKRGEKALGFALILSTLYCSFSRIWACGFLYCYPFLSAVLCRNPSKIFWLLAIGYALLPQWLWPIDTWDLLVSHYSLQGILILGSLILCWIWILKTFRSGHPHSESPPRTTKHS